ncbi:MAG: monofunctional biosynthetic peptidoglycan transglycosylase [bacterium]
MRNVTPASDGEALPRPSLSPADEDVEDAVSTPRLDRERARARTFARRHPVRTLLLRAAAGIFLFTFLQVLILRWIPPFTSAFMLQRQIGLLLHGADPSLRHRWVGWREIPPSMRLAVVAAEDQTFPHHWGFDFRSIQDAAEDNADGRRVRGASTISQQVAKNLFLWSDRSWVRKGLEAYYTVLIELLWPKRRVLEVYLNVCEFGDRVYGVAAAADTFFQEPPSRITRHEAALLAAVLPSPRRFRANRPSPYVERRAEWIEEQMAHLGPGYLVDLDSRRR